jgi:hypothetical protein
MIRFYILPIEVVDGNKRGPKYLHWRFDPDPPGILVNRYSLKDYGLIDAALVACDLTLAQHQQLAAEIDVAAAPQNLDQTVSAIALPQVVAVLEALRIPAGWVTTSHTYRELLRMVGGLFLFAQRYHGMHNEPLIDNAAQLDLRWNQIPQARRQRIQETADEMGYDYSAVQNTWLIRRILKHLGDQWGLTPILFGFVTL